MATYRNRLLEKYLKDKLEEFVTETNSKVAKKILSNFEKELQNLSKYVR